MKKLYLSLMGGFYRMIESGEKPEEYRLVNEYWVKRLTKGCTDKTALNELQKRIRKGDWYNYRIGEVDFNKGYYSEVEFTLGYPKKGDMSRRMVKQIESITIGFGNPEWGAPMFPVFIIRYK